MGVRGFLFFQRSFSKGPCEGCCLGFYTGSTKKSGSEKRFYEGPFFRVPRVLYLHRSSVRDLSGRGDSSL